jgi:hypothetical protein
LAPFLASRDRLRLRLDETGGLLSSSDDESVPFRIFLSPRFELEFERERETDGEAVDDDGDKMMRSLLIVQVSSLCLISNSNG